MFRCFGSPSATAEGRLTPFFTPSVGGGIDAVPSAALGAGVFEFDSEAFSPGDDISAGRVFDVVDDGTFGSGSSLMGGSDCAATNR